jgi:hypothetical protein
MIAESSSGTFDTTLDPSPPTAPCDRDRDLDDGTYGAAEASGPPPAGVDPHGRDLLPAGHRRRRSGSSISSIAMVKSGVLLRRSSLPTMSCWINAHSRSPPDVGGCRGRLATTADNDYTFPLNAGDTVWQP